MNIEILPADVNYLTVQIVLWGRSHFADYPWRKTTNRFHALVAEILLQRTHAEQVVPVYNRFVARFPNAASLAEADVAQVEEMIAPLGLAWRAKLLPQLGRRLSEAHGEMPLDTQSLCRLPGVGPYAAAAFLSLHAGIRAPIVDSNVVRLYGRYFGFSTGPGTRRNRAFLRLAERVTPEKKYRDFNYGLIDLTREICRPKPQHDPCPLATRCAAYRTSSG